MKSIPKEIIDYFLNVFKDKKSRGTIIIAYFEKLDFYITIRIQNMTAVASILSCCVRYYTYKCHSRLKEAETPSFAITIKDNNELLNCPSPYRNDKKRAVRFYRIMIPN